jgi:RimJ/RimL family protein N-acetyltransferase
MAEVLRTARLTLEPWSAAADELLAGLARTPAVVRYIGDGAIWSDARIAATGAQAAEHWATHGFGWRLAREAGAPVGFIALSFAGEGAGVAADEYEIGWWLAPGTWGRGLAREGAQSIRDEAFARLGAPSVLARIQLANQRSLNVARAIGLQFETQTRGRAGEAISVLRLSGAEWRARLRPAPPAGRA